VGSLKYFRPVEVPDTSQPDSPGFGHPLRERPARYREPPLKLRAAGSFHHPGVSKWLSPWRVGAAERDRGQGCGLLLTGLRYRQERVCLRFAALTYMSIRDEIQNRVAEGRMLHLPHSIPSAERKRDMFVSEEVGQVVMPPWETNVDGLRFSMLRAHLDVFTSGGLISIASDPYSKPKATYMARIDPPADEVWDIRSIDPRPAIRVLGCFAETDLFVALTWEYRMNLGGPDSKEWRDFREKCKAKWRGLFPAYQPFTGETANEYVSENAHVV
jgi:hypothetical protein